MSQLDEGAKPLIPNVGDGNDSSSVIQQLAEAIWAANTQVVSVGSLAEDFGHPDPGLALRMSKFRPEDSNKVALDHLNR